MLLSLLVASACQERSTDYPREAPSDESSAPASPEPPTKKNDSSIPKIVAFGDSLTAGYGLPSHQSYPAVLQQKLDADGFRYEVVNAGVSGDTTAGGVRRLDWALDGDVRVVILALGANDLLRGLPQSEMRKNLSTIIVGAKEKNVQVLLAGMYPPTSVGRASQREAAQIFQSIAKEHGLVFIPFLLDRVAGVSALNLEDGVHPNAEGARILADNVYKYLKPMLEKQ